MVDEDLAPTILVFTDSKNENNYRLKLPNSNIKRVVLFRTVIVLFIIYFFTIESVIARHKCPKVPAPPGVMGIISSTTLIPSGSTMAAARSSETSGCERGHPSKNFYVPKKKRLALFIRDNFNQVSQESAQGQGIHLDALVNLSGCKLNYKEFGKIMQKNYFELFYANQLDEFQEISKSKVDLVSEKFFSLISNSPLLSSRCNSI